MIQIPKHISDQIEDMANKLGCTGQEKIVFIMFSANMYREGLNAGLDIAMKLIRK